VKGANMYRINIITKVEDEKTMVAITAAINMMLEESKRTSLVVKNIKRTSAAWNTIAKHERFERKLNV
jgi:hypothetical protein